MNIAEEKWETIKEFQNYMIRSDYALENLEWVTGLENARHAFITGLNKGPGKGLNHNCNKASLDDILMLRRWYKSGFWDESKLNKVFPKLSNSYAGKISRGKGATYV